MNELGAEVHLCVIAGLVPTISIEGQDSASIIGITGSRRFAPPGDDGSSAEPRWPWER